MPPTAPTLDLPHAARPVFRGPRGPVPYIALWSGEEVVEGSIIETTNGIAYADETPVDRDARGLLWSRATTQQGVGEPLYKKLHPLRQRRAMRRLLCQVCAGPADQNEHGALWLLETQEARWDGWPNGAQSAQPPLCLRCARISVKSCPALKPGFLVVRARSFVSGAWGGVYRSGLPQSPSQFAEAANLNYGDPRIRWMQADQLTRELVGCTFVDL
jgi:hypothetical protein